MAVPDLSEAIVLGLNYEATIVRARAYLREGNVQRAIDDLNRAIDDEPRKASAFVVRGDLFLTLGKPGPAWADYDTAVKREPNVPAWVERRAIAAKLRARRGKSGGRIRRVSYFNRTWSSMAPPISLYSAIRDRLKRWQAGEITLQEARQAFEEGEPRCDLSVKREPPG